MLLVSLLWEATLAVPYHWWSFQHHQMMGLFIGAWSGLPIEEVCVWIAAVTYATAIVFEVVKVCLASERSVRQALLGATQGDAGLLIPSRPSRGAPYGCSIMPTQGTEPP